MIESNPNPSLSQETIEDIASPDRFEVGELNIIPNHELSYFGEQLCYDGIVGKGETSKGLPFQINVEGRLRKNLRPFYVYRGSEIDVNLLSPPDEQGLGGKLMGHVTYHLREINPGLKSIIIEDNLGLKNIVQITAFVSANIPRQGIGTAVLQNGEQVLQKTLEQSLAYGLFPPDTSFVRLVVDTATLEGWTQEHFKKEPDEYRAVIDNKDNKQSKTFYRIMDVKAPEEWAQSLLQLQTQEKKVAFEKQIYEITGKNKIDRKMLPNFDKDTGESLDRMPVVQLERYLQDCMQESEG
jgi:hypothetical protein